MRVVIQHVGGDIAEDAGIGDDALAAEALGDLLDARAVADDAANCAGDARKIGGNMIKAFGFGLVVLAFATAAAAEPPFKQGRPSPFEWAKSGAKAAYDAKAAGGGKVVGARRI